MNIEIINKTPEIAVAVKFEAAAVTDFAQIMKDGYQKLWSYLAKYGKQMAGAPYCKYTNGIENYTKFDIELGIPVSEPLHEQNEFYMSKTCEGKAITATHKGAYRDIEKTYAPMMQYLADNKLESTEIYYDYYLNNPADTPEGELLTKVIFLIK